MNSEKPVKASFPAATLIHGTQCTQSWSTQCAQSNFIAFCTAVFYSKLVSPKINLRTFCRSCSLLSTLKLRLTHQIIIDCIVFNASYGVSAALCSFHIKMLTKIISFFYVVLTCILLIIL